MINEKFWNCVDEEKRDQLIHHYTARGIPVEIFDDHRIAINISDQIYELSFYEAVIWYSCFFDALDYDTLVSRFKDVYSLINGGFYLGDYHEDFYKALRRLKKDNLICFGKGENRYDSIYNLFVSANIRIVNSPENQDNGYTNGVDVKPDLYNYPYAIQTSKSKLLMRQYEKAFMDMLQAGDCDIKEIERKLSAIPDSTIINSELPSSKQVTLFGLCLLRMRRIILL